MPHASFDVYSSSIAFCFESTAMENKPRVVVLVVVAAAAPSAAAAVVVVVVAAASHFSQQQSIPRTCKHVIL